MTGCNRVPYLPVLLLFLLAAPAALLHAAPADGESLQAQVPDLRVTGWAVDDRTDGNGDGGLHPGETAFLRIYLSNQGNEPARGVSGQLFEVADHPGVEILDKLATWPDLAGTGAPASSDPSHFQIRVAQTRPCAWQIPLRLELTADGGYFETQELTLEMVDPRRIDLATGAARPFYYAADQNDGLGRRHATAAGDVDGDGFDDLILGAAAGGGPANARLAAGDVVLVYGGPTRRADVQLASPPADAVFLYGASDFYNLGLSVASGDLDGDGFDDLILGGSTTVTLIWGGPTRLTDIDLAAPPAGVVFVSQADLGDDLGRMVGSADLDGDGFDDLILGARGGDGPGNARPSAGEVAVLYGGPTRLRDVDLAAPPGGVAFIYGVDAEDELGWAVATGDLDGDGFSDLILGARYADGPGNARNQAGETAVIYGGPARLTDLDLAAPPAGVAFLYGADEPDEMPQAVASGDLDGDGFDDAILGSFFPAGLANARGQSGEIVVIHGGPARLSDIDLASPPANVSFVFGAEFNDHLGHSLASGDVDGDGFDDLIAGASLGMGPGNTRIDAGEAVIIHGGPAWPSLIDLATPPEAATFFYGVDLFDRLGDSVASGDLDGDGLDEVILGAPDADGRDNLQPYSGEVAVIPGAPRSRYRHDPDPFSLIDATIGANLGLACDDCAATIPIGFDFDFFGRRQTEVTVSSNGYLTFGGTGNRLPAFCLPHESLPSDTIAVLWDDWDPSAGGAVYSLLEGTAPNRRLTVQWAGVPHYNVGGDATFEVTLLESSDQIVMQYDDTLVGGPPDSGGTAVVGVENALGVNGAAASCFTAGIESNSARRFRRFASPTVFFSDDVESGVGVFGATGLWHREQDSISSCTPASRSGDWSWYYGQSIRCDYDTGGTNSGTLTTEDLLGLPQDARLSFWHRREAEDVPSLDVSKVQVADPTFKDLAQVFDKSNVWRLTEDLLPPDPEAGSFSSLDLSKFAGQDVQLRFLFDTVDANANSTLGWMIDDITIRACPVFGAGGEAAVAAEARATVQPDTLCETDSGRVDAVGSYCAACGGALTYQWREDGAPIPLAAGVEYVVPAMHAVGTFDYSVEIGCSTNPACTAASAPAPVEVVPVPSVVGPTLQVDRPGGTDLRFLWADVSGADDYVVLSSTAAAGAFVTQVGSATSGSSGLTAPVPPDSLTFFQVAGRNPTCGQGPLS